MWRFAEFYFVLAFEGDEHVEAARAGQAVEIVGRGEVEGGG